MHFVSKALAAGGILALAFSVYAAGAAPCTPDVFLQRISLPAGGSPDDVAVADFNGDGVPDVALGATGVVDFFKGNGNGTFQSPVPFPATGGIIHFVVAADLDGSGKPDLVVEEGPDVA